VTKDPRVQTWPGPDEMALPAGPAARQHGTRADPAEAGLGSPNFTIQWIVAWRTSLSDLLALIATGEMVVALSAMSIRNLDERVKERLRVRAARHGRSMEAEARAILTDAVSEPGEAGGLARAILDRFGELGGVELDLPPRQAQVRAAEFR
jgi:plasmid stability protein